MLSKLLADKENCQLAFTLSQARLVESPPRYKGKVLIAEKLQDVIDRGENVSEISLKNRVRNVRGAGVHETRSLKRSAYHYIEDTPLVTVLVTGHLETFLIASSSHPLLGHILVRHNLALSDIQHVH